MPGLRNDLEQIIQEKRGALAGKHGQDLHFGMAEVIYLETLLEKNPMQWDLNPESAELRNLLENEIRPGNYSEKRREVINSLVFNVTNVYSRLKLSEEAPLPSYLNVFVINPAYINNQDFMTARNRMYRDGYRFNLLYVPKEGMGDEQFKAFCNEYKIGDEEDYGEELKAVLRVFGVRNPNGTYSYPLYEASANTGLLTDRSATHANTFVMYLVGKRGMSIGEALKIAPGQDGFENLKNDFLTFANSHPTLRKPGINITEEERQANVKAWLEMFNNFGDAIGDYKIPDIDYSDPNAVLGQNREFARVISLMVDYGQQIEPFLNNNSDTLSNLPGEREKALKKMEHYHTLRQFLNKYRAAYGAGKDNLSSSDAVETYVRTNAVNRALRSITELEDTPYLTDGMQAETVPEIPNECP